MRDDYWPAVETLFVRASALAPAAREKLLEAHRAESPDVAAEVESLLAAENAAGSFLRTLAADPVAATGPLVAAPRGSFAARPRRISHYEVLERLGAGGMGEVFRARDLALSRDAALKLLPPQVDPRLKATLLAEAEAAARLQHPAIATFFEAGDAGGEAFIAMEFVRGETLRARLARGALPLGEVLTITRGLLEALSHAHAAGILHRDIKPENVMLTEAGAPKLLDFGIAKRLLIESDDQLTVMPVSDATSLVGTPGYFAPEQVLGEPLDPRTDLFQLGAVVYEMLTGAPAFAGRSPFQRLAAMVAQHVNWDALRTHDVADEVIAVLRRTLARDPGERPESAPALLRELTNVAQIAAPLPPTLAVLDFQELTLNEADIWIGSGLAESLAVALRQVEGLELIGRDRVARATREAAATGHIAAVHVGRLLGCRWTLSGHYERRDDQLRVTATLTDVAIGEPLAEERIAGAIDAITTIPRQLVDLITGRLHLHAPASGAAVTHHRVFELNERARRLWFRFEKGAFDEAMVLFGQALGLDPGDAQAATGLAACHSMRFTYTTDRREVELAEMYARQAIGIDPDASDPYVWLGYARWRQRDSPGALAALERAIDRQGDNAMAWYFAGCVHYYDGRGARGISCLQRSLQIDGFQGFRWMILGSMQTTLGDLENAEWCLRRARRLESGHAAGWSGGAGAYLADCLRLQGRLDDARAECIGALSIVERSDHMYRDTFRGVALCTFARTAAAQGDVPAARAAYEQVLAHVRGRTRTLGGGHLVVQALAGLAAAGDAERLDEALAQFERRAWFDFSFVSGCEESTTLLALGEAALALARSEARPLLARASAAGSAEARRRLASLDA